MSDNEDIKKHMDIMKAAMAVVEVMLPFSPMDRLRIITQATLMGGVKAILFADIEESIRNDPALKELLEKIKPRARG